MPSRFAMKVLMVCESVLILLHRLFEFWNYPTAHGPWIARFTRWWYAWKVYEGKFEQWSIEQHSRHGRFIRVAPHMYSIRDPLALKQIYGIDSPMPKSSWYLFFGNPRSPNLFSETDPHFHSAMRRSVANLYSMTSLKSYEQYVDRCISVLQEHFDRCAFEGTPIDIQRWAQAYAFDVIGEITFGSRIGMLDSGGQDVDGIIQGLERSAGFSSLAGIDMRLLPVLFAVFGNPTKGLFAFSDKLQTLRREKGSLGAEKDFFSKCEALREKDPEAYAKFRKDQVITGNLTAGSDTTSIALTSALYHIFKDRDVYLRLKQEIRRAEERGQAQDPISFEEAQALPYLQKVLKEALRIHPPTGLPLWRVVPAPGMTISGSFFPKDVMVGVNPWVCHHDPDVFENPAVFNPDRWDPEITSADRLKVMEACYMPFGLGSRTCIGKNISILEMTKLVPQLVRRYEFELLRPEEPLKSRNWWFVWQKNVFARIRSCGKPKR